MLGYETERLRLRQWLPEDYGPYSEMSVDPRVMRYFPDPLGPAESRAMADRIRGLIEERGWGFWAVELKAEKAFIGFTGLHVPRPELPFSPCVEIGWRLAYPYWGKGYALEAAKAALEVGFTRLGLKEIVAFATAGNERSLSLMRKLDMRRSEDFEHPLIPEGHPLRPHHLYRLPLADWEARSW